MIGLLTGASALALLSGAAEAASLPVVGVDSVAPARSFAELLDPIPNAAGILRASLSSPPTRGLWRRRWFWLNITITTIIITTTTIITTIITTTTGGAIIGIITTTEASMAGSAQMSASAEMCDRV